MIEGLVEAVERLLVIVEHVGIVEIFVDVVGHFGHAMAMVLP